MLRRPSINDWFPFALAESVRDDNNIARRVPPIQVVLDALGIFPPGEIRGLLLKWVDALEIRVPRHRPLLEIVCRNGDRVLDYGYGREKR